MFGMLLSEDFIIYSVLAILWVEFIWEYYLTLRQHKKYKQYLSIPTELEGTITHETYEKSRVYGLDKSKFGMVNDWFSIIFTTLSITFYWTAFFWNTSTSWSAHLGFPDNEYIHTAIFVAITNIFSTVTSLPFTIYKTFVLEEKHGFNKETPGFFIKDQIKHFILAQLIMVPLSTAFVWIIQAGGDYFFIYLWLFTTFVSLALLTIYPDYIAPMFDKYTPLPEGDLKTKIEELASSIKFPLYKLYLVEGSKRSHHSNAYLYGFFKNKRIVLYDTLVKEYNKEGEGKGCDTEEVIAVLAHELGHWKCNHVLHRIILIEINLFFQFFAFALLFKYKELYRAFGFSTEPVVIGLLIVLQYIFTPYNALLGFFFTYLSRKNEFEADDFAKKLNKAHYLKKSLIKLHIDNLSFPVYDWLYSSWHHSHPTLLQRLEALNDKSD